MKQFVPTTLLILVGLFLSETIERTAAIELRTKAKAKAMSDDNFGGNYVIQPMFGADSIEG